ncbi:hypothetical protein Vafri_17277 [Volvox africanus]|uniref:Uncharacterized protein n=1 Tax=Volvox africanus TaxID=51714 RepID=A0A8J4BQ55_9CHLO|nr:hypothetical protein Vafri_17277 [Volvox africanus]
MPLLRLFGRVGLTAAGAGTLLLAGVCVAVGIGCLRVTAPRRRRGRLGWTRPLLPCPRSWEARGLALRFGAGGCGPAPVILGHAHSGHELLVLLPRQGGNRFGVHPVRASRLVGQDLHE